MSDMVICHLMLRDARDVMCGPVPKGVARWYRCWAPGDPFGDHDCHTCRRIAEGGDE